MRRHLYTLHATYSRHECYGRGHRPASGMCARSCFTSLSFVVFILASAFHIPLSRAANFSVDGFHPSHVLSVSSLSSFSSSFEDMTPGGEIQEKEVLYHFFRNGRSKNDVRKLSTTFMVGLFNELQRRRGITTNDSSGSSTDTIRCFSGQNAKYTKTMRSVVEFHIPHLPTHEKLIHAEFRFLKNQTNTTRSRKYKFIIQVKRNGKVVRRIVLSQRLDPQEQHSVFDMTRIVAPWINDFHGDITFHVKISRKFQRQTMTASSDMSLQSSSLIVLYLEDGKFLKTMYASLTSDGAENSPHPSAQSSSKTKRTSPEYYDLFLNSSSRVPQPLASYTDSSSRERRNIPKRKRRNRVNKKWSPKSSQKENCQMYDFNVDFSVIGWGQWIVHPKKFNARFCHGTCPSPIDVQYSPTNHAVLQTLMRMKRPHTAPAPCCVPTKLSPISMLYFEYDELVVRHHENMIATECGCR